MKLSKISYMSAVFIGVFSLVLSLVYGILQWIARDVILELYGVQTTFFQAVVLTPLMGGFIAYFFTLLTIFFYNMVAKKYPIAWEVKK